MDLLLLLAQLGVVLLLVVMPLINSYDRFVAWSPQKKLFAVLVATLVAVVVFTQYRQLRLLHTESLAESLESPARRGALPWYVRPLFITPLEYVLSVGVMAVMLSQGVAEAKLKRWARAVPWLLAAVLLPAVALTIKLRVWR
jgi:hypothetical protein